MRFATLLSTALLAACGPTVPTPVIPPPAPPPAPDAAPPDAPPDAPTEVSPRVAAAMPLFEHFVVALEAAHGDCDGAAVNLRAFADTDDGRAIAALALDPTFAEATHREKDAIEATYTPVLAHLLAIIIICRDSPAMSAAIAASPLFPKH